MKFRILTYIGRIDKLLENDDSNTPWDEVEEEHLVQIAFFQHERLIHLIVTVLVALLFIATIGIAMIADYIPMFLVSLALCVLLAPYIMHYYLLENKVQYMYKQYDRIREKSRDFKKH